MFRMMGAWPRSCCRGARCAGKDSLGGGRFSTQRWPSGNVVVPLDQGRDRAGSFDDMRVEIPDRLRDRRSVGVDEKRRAEIVGFCDMPAEMNFLYPIERKRIQIWQGLGAVVGCRHQHV